MLSCESNINKHGVDEFLDNSMPLHEEANSPTMNCGKIEPANQNIEAINHLSQLKQVKCEWKKTNITYDVNIINETATPRQICFILTVHDLGKDSSQFDKLIYDEKMEGIRNRVIWLNVNLPGQEPESPDLEAKKYPTLEELGDGLVTVLNDLKIPQVVCMGQGAGANIAFYFAVKHPSRCLGLALIDPVGSSAGLVESIRRMFGTRGKSISGESSIENRATEHRNSHGSILARQRNSQSDTFNVELIDPSKLAEHRNSKNLALFADAYFNRESLTDRINELKVDTLIACGKNSASYAESKKLYRAFQESNRKTPARMVNSPFLELENVTSVLSESADRLAFSLQYFLQGIGLISAMPLRSSLRSASISSGTTSVLGTPPGILTNEINSNLERSTSLEEEGNPGIPGHSGSSQVSSSDSDPNLNNNEKNN